MTRRLHFAQYLMLATGHRDPRFKLRNREVFDGFVFVSEEEYKVLISPPAPAAHKKEFKMPKGVKVKAFPPCITDLGRKLGQGVNLTHEGRFLMVSFLSAVGAESEDIVALFARSPDYNAEYTDYQVNHISARDYKCPGCEWIKHAHLCKGCGDYKHPIKFYLDNYHVHTP
jgi:DNA primase large subunit